MKVSVGFHWPGLFIAELWENAENLHRYDLTKEQRDEHIRRYAELLTARDAMASELLQLGWPRWPRVCA